MKQETIAITKTEFRALASETRTGILKLLTERQYNLTELSKKMGLSGPTIKQHLDILQQAELIEVAEEGKKWKYYGLTKKGKRIFAEQPEYPLTILLGITTIALAIIMILLLGTQPAQFASDSRLGEQIEKQAVEQNAPMQTTEEGATATEQNITTTRTQLETADNTLLVLAAVIIAAAEGFLIAKALR